MDILRAKEILTILADGTNPLTGEVLPNSDSCNQVEVVRALHAVLNALNHQEEKNKKSQWENAGKPWSAEEKEQLIQEYHTGLKIHEISKKHGRSRGAIEAKLAQVGLIDKTYFTMKVR